MNAIHTQRLVRRRVACSIAVLMALSLLGCTVQPSSSGGGATPGASGGGTNGGNNGAGGTGGGGTGGGGNSGGGGTGTSGTGGGGTGGGGAGSGGGGQTASVSGTFQPATGLHLEAENIILDVPAGALAAATEITLTSAASVTLPAVVPGASALAGAEFGPSGLVFGAPANVSVHLAHATIATAMPVITFDSTRNRWVGTGATGTVAANGLDVTFELQHFSITGVPDGTPIPDPGDAIGPLLAVSNNGTFTSDEISSDAASVLYSDFGTTFSISLFSQEVNNQGQIETKSLGLSSILVTRVDNYIVGVVGGATSLFNEGSFNEPAVGVMIMSLVGGRVSTSVYVATPERVIHGALTGTP